MTIPSHDQEIGGSISRSAKAVPELEGGWPLFGHLWRFQKDPIAMLMHGIQEHGELFQFRLGTKNFALFSGPEAHDAYFAAPDDQLDPQPVYRFTVPIFGRGVAYDVAPEIMTEQLGFLFPALRESAMRRFARIMHDETSLFADAMGAEGVLDLPTAMNQLTVNIACRCFLGEKMRREMDAGFAEAYHELQNGINTIGFFYPRLPIPAHRRRDQARRKVVKVFNQIMNERRATDTNEDDFMHRLMNAHYSDGRPLTDDEITGILLTALFAGQHTSAVLATWTGLEMVRDGAYVDKVRGELREVYANDGSLNFDGLKSQKVMEYAVRECERLHPPLILLIRIAAKPFNYRGMDVPANTVTMVSPAVSHRLPEIFKDPDRFHPERFAPPTNEGDQHQYALIGFGGGKHRCMGKNFGIMQIKALWSVLLDRFDFALEMKEFPAPNYGSWVTGPVLPCRMRYRARSQTGVFQ